MAIDEILKGHSKNCQRNCLRNLKNRRKYGSFFIRLYKGENPKKDTDIASRPNFK